MIGYMKISQGVEGEAKDANHKGWIKILQVQYSTTRPVASTAGSHRSTDRAVLSDFVVTKEYDKSSPKLREMANTGKPLDEIMIHLVTSVGAGTESTFLEVKLENVIVSSYQVQGSLQGSHHPTELVAFNFKKITEKYTPYDEKGNAGGPVDTNWDISENKKM